MLGSSCCFFVTCLYCVFVSAHLSCELLPLKITVWTERRWGSRRGRNERRSEGSFVIKQHKHIKHFVVHCGGAKQIKCHGVKWDGTPHPHGEVRESDLSRRFAFLFPSRVPGAAYISSSGFGQVKTHPCKPSDYTSVVQFFWPVFTSWVYEQERFKHWN